MNKFWLITRREYLVRVRKPSFIIMTLLGPFFFTALWLVPLFLQQVSQEQYRILVVDESSYFANELKPNASLNYEYSVMGLASARPCCSPGLVMPGCSTFPCLSKGSCLIHASTPPSARVWP
ncbi:MAG: hypothetical protein HC842_09515 [Cytophagales bacterium]|nr:hypothetical protein [Cytophagales bacterium]